jgi:CTP:phosphocholine cytidylyltransferase-like protein
MLNKVQFLVLTEIERNKNKLVQRELAKLTDLSIGTINKAVSYLQENFLIDDMTITDKGLEELEPYRVKRAIFLAAGFGSRLVPITFNTPKPLVRVFGKRMIEYSLEAVAEAGIEEIIIVRGYLGEQFDVLLNKYPNIKFIDNPLYKETNNISSALLIADKLENAYVLEADLVLSNKRLISKYQYTSNYLGVPVEKTDDWCFKVSNGIINKMMIGGINCHHMYGISYWNSIDGKKLSQHIPEVFNMPG